MSVRILPGDCRDVLPTLEAESVHCVVTSPPYYGLRDYGTAQWDGGDSGCDHAQSRVSDRSRVQHEEWAPPSGWTNRDASPAARDTCGKCGARRVDRQIGLEASPQLWLDTMVQVFREVRRVMRPDATLWLNCGDSYAGSSAKGAMRPGNVGAFGHNSNWGDGDRNGMGAVPGLKPKDLMLMPARLALALQADGWWVRSMMPWVKRAAMPESCTDRPASAIEYVFLLTKSARYFWDGEAVKRVQSDNTHERFGKDGVRSVGCPKESEPGRGIKNNGSMAAALKDMVRGGRNFRNSDLFYDSLEAPHGLICDDAGDPLALDVNPAGYNGAHFATFPPKLIEPLLRSGTSERGCCSACGAPWVREVERAFIRQQDVSAERGMRLVSQHDASNQWPDTPRGRTDTTTTGWRASCQCFDSGLRCVQAAVVPCTVLDPFSGAGTTLMVADRLQRDAIGIDLNPTYNAMASERITDDCPLFTSWQPAEPPEDARMADLFAEAAE